MKPSVKRLILSGALPLDPKLVPNLNLLVDSSVTGLVQQDGAIQFTAGDKAYLTSTSADFNLGTGDFAWNIWIYRDATGAKVFFTRYQDSNNYWQFGVNSSNVAYFIAVIGGSTLINVLGTTALSGTSTWYNLHLNVSRTVAASCGIWLNGTVDTAGTPTTSTSTIDNTGAFQVGANGALTAFASGRMDSFGFWKATTVSTANITALYNAGAGLIFSGVTGSLLTSLVSWYDFGEEDGIRYDSVGANNLSQVFAEMTTNGTFTGNDTGWTHGTDWAYGVNNEVATAASTDLAQSTTVPVAGHKYSVTYTIVTATSGSLAFTFGGVTGQTRSTAATFTEYIKTTSAATLAIHNVSAFTGVIDTVSVTCTEIPSAGGIAAGNAIDGNLCGSFNGTSQYLSIADAGGNISLNPLASDFAIAAWGNLAAITAAVQTLIAKGAASGSLSGYNLWIDTAGKVNLAFGDGSAARITKTFTSVLSPNNWYQLIVNFTRAANAELFINTATDGTVAISAQAGSVSNALAFALAASSAGTLFLGGRLDGGLYIKRVLTAPEITAIFNKGKGVKFAGLPSTVSSDSTLSFYNLDEFSSGGGLVTRLDSGPNANSLTDHGNTPSGQGVDYYEGSVSKWIDRSNAANTLIQPAEANRLMFVTNAQNGKPVLRGDGLTKSIYNAADLIGTGNVTVVMVIKPRGWGGSNIGRIISNGFFILRGNSASGGVLQIFSDGATVASSGVVSLTTPYVLVITRTLGGIVNFYINGILSGSANQASGTPSSGNPTYIGNTSAGTVGFDGDIDEIVIAKKILTLPQIISLTRYLRKYWNI